MAFVHRLQDRRFELKYLVSERCAKAVREYAGAHLVHDEHGQSHRGFSYPVNSLYLDTPDMALCRATLDGVRDRFKLRIRYYDETAASPVFFEIKHRVDRVLRKSRAIVARGSVPRLLAGGQPRRSDLLVAEGREPLQRFLDLAMTIGASGRVIVSYDREAWVTPQDNSVRLTFDRRISVRRFEAGDPLVNGRRSFHLRMGGVILELKFTNSFPSWMNDMVLLFDLERSPLPKYVKCVQALSTGDYRRMRAHPEVAV